jgi:hypothetical protein
MAWESGVSGVVVALTVVYDTRVGWFKERLIRHLILRVLSDPTLGGLFVDCVSIASPSRVRPQAR